MPTAETHAPPPSIERFTSADGTTIGARRTGSGPPLVLVHGSAGDSARWALVVPQLSERFTVYAVDRRGRGASDDHGRPYDIAREYEDVAAVVDALPEPAVVVGHSYGAIAALEATRLTGNVASLVLYEGPLPVGLPIYEPKLVTQLEALLAAGARDELLTVFMREVPRVPESHIDTMKRQPSWAARRAAAHTIPRELRSVNDLPADIYDCYTAVDVPTLLLTGSLSPAFLTEPSRILLDEVLPNAEAAVFEGHAHSAMDTATDEFVERIVEFAQRAG